MAVCILRRETSGEHPGARAAAGGRLSTAPSTRVPAIMVAAHLLHLQSPYQRRAMGKFRLCGRLSWQLLGTCEHRSVNNCVSTLVTPRNSATGASICHRVSSRCALLPVHTLSRDICRADRRGYRLYSRSLRGCRCALLWSADLATSQLLSCQRRPQCRGVVRNETFPLGTLLGTTFDLTERGPRRTS